MNTVLHENRLERYIQTYSAVKEMEISGETVVPDKMPDIGLLGDTTAFAMLRAKRLESGRGSMEGDLAVGVCYIPDGASGLRTLELTLPWQTEYLSDEVSQEGIAVGRVWVKQAETRMLNPRKILVKVKLCAEMTVYEKRTISVCDRAEASGVVQFQTKAAQCSMISTVTEKTFAATDEYPLPPDLIGGEIIGKSVQFRVDDVKSLNNKLIVKGSVLSEVMLCGQSGTAEKIGFTSAFSLIAETDCADVLPNARVDIVPTAIYYELTSNEQLLSVEVHGVCQITAFTNEQVSYLSDAYSNFYDCSLMYEDMVVYSDVKSQTQRETISGKLMCRSQAAQICFLTASLHTESFGENGDVSVIVSAYVRYENGTADRVKSRAAVPMKGREGKQLNTVRVCDLYGALNGTEIEFRAQLDLELREETRTVIRSITSVTIDEDMPKTEARPSLMLVKAETDLWELARRYGSTVELLKVYNDLEDDEEPTGLMMIPRQRK